MTTECMQPMFEFQGLLQRKVKTRFDGGTITSNTEVWVLMPTAKGLGDNSLWRIAKLNGIPYLPDVGSKTTAFSAAFAGIFASN